MSVSRDLKRGKSAGNDHVNSEHFIYASNKMYVYVYPMQCYDDPWPCTFKTNGQHIEITYEGQNG